MLIEKQVLTMAFDYSGSESQYPEPRYHTYANRNT